MPIAAHICALGSLWGCVDTVPRTGCRLIAQACLVVPSWFPSCVVQAMQSACTRLEVVMNILEKELPDTMAAMRLSSLEVSDCVEEFTGLGYACQEF